MAPLTGLVVKSLITSPLEGASLPRDGSRSPGSHGPVTRISPASTCRSITARRGSPARSSASGCVTRGVASNTSSTPEQAASYLILSRATDANGDVQPAVSHWNPSGYLWNQYDSVRVEVK